MKRKLGRIWHFIETADNVEMTDASDRIREHRDRQERLEDLAAEARAILSQRRADLDDVETIAAYAQDMSEFLKESELTERRAFIETFVKEIVVMPGDALLRYTIPISQSTPKTELLVGGRSEEFWVGDEAEASSQLVGDVEGRLHPEERPRVELWPTLNGLTSNFRRPYSAAASGTPTNAPSPSTESSTEPTRSTSE